MYFVKRTATYCHKIETDSKDEAESFISSGWYEVSKTDFDNTKAYTNTQITVEELQAENKLLKAQLQAQVDRSYFIEDCIAEMAMAVYGEV